MRRKKVDSALRVTPVLGGKESVMVESNLEFRRYALKSANSD
jgi:hypothetical protein